MKKIRHDNLIIFIFSAYVLAVSHCVRADQGFTGVAIESPFDSVLEGNPLLMQSGGARIVVNSDGGCLVIAVGQVDYDRTASPQARLNKERVARQNALRELTARTAPIQIVHRETSEEISRIETLSGGEQRASAIENYLSVTTSKFEAVVKDLPEVGKWYSEEEDILYIAIGMQFPADGERP